MRRSASLAALLFAWLCATGMLWDVVQVLAWGRMFTAYAEKENVAAALNDTFDSRRPCALCQALNAARDTTRHESPAPTSPGRASERVLFLCENIPSVSPATGKVVWPAIPDGMRSGPSDEVPVPPPRA